MKIACYGYIDKHSGSLAGANHLVLEQLLQHDVEIDLFGWPSFNCPEDLMPYQNFNFIEVPSSTIKNYLFELTPKPLKHFFSQYLWSAVHTAIDASIDQSYLRQVVLDYSQKVDYDVLLFLGLASTFSIPKVPTVSWLQGTPHTELKYIKKLRNEILNHGGLSFFLTAMIYYPLESKRIRHNHLISDFLICGSSWSRNNIIEYGLPADSIDILPYPVDLDLFDRSKEKFDSFGHEKKFTFLWLGRIDPRKRFDLMISAYKLLLAERSDVHLKVVGQFKHVQGYREIMMPLVREGSIEYISYLEREKVPDLLSECDALVQPSEAENFGSSVAEAVCCGLPVVLGETNGTKDFVGELGIIFDEYTPEAVRDAMLRAMEMRQIERQQVLAKNIELVRSTLNAGLVADKLNAILQQTSENFIAQVST